MAEHEESWEVVFPQPPSSLWLVFHFPGEEGSSRFWCQAEPPAPGTAAGGDFDAELHLSEHNPGVLRRA